MTLKVGDKVRLTDNPHNTNVHPRLRPGREYRVRTTATPDCVLLEGYERHVHEGRLEKIEEEPPRPLGLQAGDKVVNLKTGREGLVLKGPVSGVLKVYDQKPPIKDAVPAQALEEYEFHHPGTYDVWRLSNIVRQQAQPW